MLLFNVVIKKNILKMSTCLTLCIFLFTLKTDEILILYQTEVCKTKQNNLTFNEYLYVK